MAWHLWFLTHTPTCSSPSFLPLPVSWTSTHALPTHLTPAAPAPPCQFCLAFQERGFFQPPTLACLACAPFLGDEGKDMAGHVCVCYVLCGVPIFLLPLASLSPCPCTLLPARRTPSLCFLPHLPGRRLCLKWGACLTVGHFAAFWDIYLRL